MSFLSLAAASSERCNAAVVVCIQGPLVVGRRTDGTLLLTASPATGHVTRQPVSRRLSSHGRVKSS